MKAGRFDQFDCPTPPRSLFHTIEREQLQGRNVFTLRPGPDNKGKEHILYLHGGAYVQGFSRPHWYFLSRLIKETGVTITAPDYPLAPFHTYQDGFAMVESLYKQLITDHDPASIVLMGDSAGGGFALALAQKLKSGDLPVPGQIILLSPWLDITLKNPVIEEIASADPFLGKESLQRAGKLYAGDTSPDHYLLSPINGPMQDLGKITVFAGSCEILVADARKLKGMAISAGTELEYHEYPGMFHTWMLLNLPESKKTRQQIAALIRSSNRE